MSKFKIVGMMALIVFAMAIFLVGDALAGEKHRLSIVYHTVKWEQMNVPAEEGHLVGLWEGKGIIRNKDGKPFGEGWITHSVGYVDINTKTGIGSAHFYDEWIDRDGDKFCTKSAGTMKAGGPGGTLTITRGTGKYEGIRGEAAWENHPAGPDQSYSDLEMEVELPR